MSTAKRKRLLAQTFDVETENAKRAALDRRQQHGGLEWEVTTWRDCVLAPGLPFRAWIIAVAQSTEKSVLCEHDLVFNAGNHFIVIPNIKQVACLEYDQKENTSPVVQLLAHVR